MLFWTHKPSSICVEECKLLLRILIGQQPITLLVLGQKQGWRKNWANVKQYFSTFFNTFFIPFFNKWNLKTRKEKKFLWTFIPIQLLSHPCPCVNVTMLHLCPVLSIGRLIITQRRGWGSFGGASALVMPAFKTIYCPDIFMTMVLGDSWPEYLIQQPDDHVMLAESKLMTRRGSWAGQSSSVSPEFWMIERSGKACQLNTFSLVFISGEDQYSL